MKFWKALRWAGALAFIAIMLLVLVFARHDSPANGVNSIEPLSAPIFR